MIIYFSEMCQEAQKKTSRLLNWHRNWNTHVVSIPRIFLLRAEKRAENSNWARKWHVVCFWASERYILVKTANATSLTLSMQHKKAIYYYKRPQRAVYPHSFQRNAVLFIIEKSFEEFRKMLYWRRWPIHIPTSLTLSKKKLFTIPRGPKELSIYILFLHVVHAQCWPAPQNNKWELLSCIYKILLTKSSRHKKYPKARIVCLFMRRS